MSESPSAGELKKGSTARAQEGINSKGKIIDIQYPINKVNRKVEKATKT